MKTSRKELLARLIILTVFLAVQVVFGGSLEPGSAPGATMKTLDEVSPGTAISSIPYTIVESGYYYLTSSVQNGSLFHGITIWADNVTLDLKGFSMIGDDSLGRHGVAIEGIHKNITIRNGTIRDFDNGILESSTQGRGHKIIGVGVLSNRGNGIRLLGGNHLVNDCTVSDNGTLSSDDVHGILVQGYSSVTNNKVYNNGGSSFRSVEGIFVGNGSKVSGNVICSNGISATGGTTGIHANIGCTVTGNTIVSNGGSSSSVKGLWTSNGSTITGNTVCLNGTSASGTVFGILANPGCTVSNNTVSENGKLASNNVYGIYAYSGCMVSGNVAYKNGYGASSFSDYSIYGIYASESSTVMDNTASENGGAAEGSGGPLIYGIFANAGSTVTGNTSSKNATPVFSGIAAGIYLGEYSVVDQNTSYDNKGLSMNNPGNCSFGVNVPQLP